MGVSTNFYTILGTKLEFNDFFFEQYDEVFEDKDTPFVLLDAMCGEYIILGVTLFDSGDMRWGFEDGDIYKEINITELNQMEAEYKIAFTSKFPEFSYFVKEPFKIISVCHYS